ncbi:DUF3131 domain-containing protein [Noviherbaspirillum galbum]|uniref:DUF3131 domain-containing protein n=1 Tax=Noviherbaspirillum galbum TaxID=2709383 RepID=A0A6B3SWS2_9BURK|nr:DUF3131 domain-containing protein [Noviherbaspirillum galbum]NEX63925.1 DUF3131 domain-containing protein [Noviherbaspirillum galbum]
MNKENLIRARSNIIFILALIIGFALVMMIERNSVEPAAARSKAPAASQAAPPVAASRDLPQPPELRGLNPSEQAWARIAWHYFERNVDPATGLAHSVDNYQATTMWDSASYLLALMSAERIGLVGRKEFDQRMDKALASLASLPLQDGALPNKSYSTSSLAMVDYTGKPAPDGIGWSALDIARLLVPLGAIAWNYPEHAAGASKLVGRWQLQRMVRDGALAGMHRTEDGKLQLLQEGRLGYEQYGARALALTGMSAPAALDYDRQLAYVDIYGIAVPRDLREAATGGAHNYVLSEPYVLDGLELGWDQVSRELAWRVYRAQEERFRRTGQLTAVSEDHLDRAPYFAYNTIYADGKPWFTLTDTGKDVSALRSISVKAAFGWYALFRTPYATQLVEAIAPMNDPERGWYAGMYEADKSANKALTANTNAVVLESLSYIARGRLLGPSADLPKEKP